MGFGPPEFHVVRPKPDKVDARYLLHLLRGPEVRREGEMRMIGSAGQKRIPAAFVESLKIPFPPLPEQRRIAASLDQADELRAKRSRALALLDELADSIFMDMFGDTTINSRGFKLRSFGKLGQLDRGVSRTRPRNTPGLLGGKHPLIQTGDVANSGGYIRTFSQTYSDRGLAQSKTWDSGTLAITIAANIAKGGILTFAACFPDSVVGFNPCQSKVNVEYIRFWLSSVQHTLERQAPSSAQKNINLAILRSLRVPVPSLERQEIFADRIALVESVTQEARNHLAKLDELFASLQHRAFRGEL